MPLTLKARRKPAIRIAITLLSGLLPMLLGLTILYMQAERGLEHSTRQTAEEAIRQFDLMLDNTAIAAQELLPLAGQPCADVKLAPARAGHAPPLRTLDQPGMGQQPLLQFAVW